ncbi:hypothetical protein OG613_28015 [Streptomyces sp. NBC_00015]|uniref:hypothetical protein n=1 Tax=unclassified Streptomyces TaxID=2593676 RepID=UPI002258D0AF|nr:hypothetical protein [Streptomyces sp. NBC_00103]MCX5368452.1 hypothetical protein [Streptomyces sp. NBC_00103]
MADARRRLRSGTVVLGGMGVLAAALSACSSDPDKRCVDRDSYNLTKGYKVVADKNCKSTSGKSGSSGKVGRSATDAAWYYGGDKKGSWVDGGSFTKPGKGSSGSTGSSSSGGGSSSSGGSGSGSSGGSGVDRNGFGGDSDSGSGVGKGSSGG